MLESLSAVLQAVRESGPRIIAVVAVASGSLLFLPSTMLGTLGLDMLLAEHRPTIGLVFLVAVAIVVVDLVRFVMARLKSQRKQHELEEGRLRVLATLTDEERQYLAPYILEGKNTCYYSVDDGVAGGLNKKGILYIASDMGSLVDGFAFNMQPWAREALSKKHEAFQGITHRPPTPRDRFWGRW